jgi:hypothetical protein
MKAALACALVGSADSTVTANLIELLSNPTHGATRAFLVEAVDVLAASAGQRHSIG